MATQVIVTKSKIDKLNDKLSAAVGASANRTLDQMNSVAAGVNTTISAQSDLLDQAISALVGKAGDGAAKAAVTYSQQNDYITDYLAGELTAAEYAADATAERADIPVGAPVTLAADGTSFLRDGLGGSCSTSETAGAKTIYNLCPGKDSQYINHVNGAISQVGFLKPTGKVRMIYTNHGTNTVKTANCRDLGGWAADGGTLHYGKIFRGSRFNGKTTDYASDHDKRVFVDLLGVRDEIDLRNDYERTQTDVAFDEISGKRYSAFGNKVDYVGFPLLNDVSIIYSLSTASVSAAYADAIHRIVIDLTYGRPVYVHCSAGADRTGVLCLLVEALCGVSEADVQKEYGLTAFSCKTDGYSSNASKTDTNTSMLGVITALKNLAGSGSTLFEGALTWALSQGISYAEINTLRQKLIDGTPETIIEPEEVIVNILDDVGYANNHRMDSSGQDVTSSATGYCLPGYIPITYGDVIRFTGADIRIGSATSPTTYLCYYKYENGEYVKTGSVIGLRTGDNGASHTIIGFFTASMADGVVAIKMVPGEYAISASNTGDNSEATHVRFNVFGNGEDMFMTKNQAITEVTE